MAGSSNPLPDFLGTGWALPIDVAGGRFAQRADEPLIEQSILIILQTSKGERVMEPEFGCDLKQLVFTPDNNATSHVAEYAVKDALERWEPRISVLEVTATPDRSTPSRLLISVDYLVRSHNSRHNLVYPFNLG